MAEHTPVPWRTRCWEEPVWIIETEKGFVAQTVGSNDEANAAFIVRACNAHADLLAACKAAFKHICEGCPSESGPCSQQPDDAYSESGQCCAAEAGNALRAAVAKAEGKDGD